jgi:ATP/maltotriose-dependent transcriptional regulator MalT
VATSAREDSEVRSESWLNLAADCLRLGHLERVPGLLRDAEALARQNTRLAWRSRIRLYWLAAEYWLAQGQAARAAEFASQSDVLAQQHQAWKYAVLAAKALADAKSAQGAWAEARAHLRHAADVLSSHPVPLIAWRVHGALGQLYDQSGEHDHAAALMESARTEVRRLADNIAEAPLKTAFLRSRTVRAVLDEEATISDEQ